MQLYELALADGETSRDLMARARAIGLGHLTATSDVTDAEIAALRSGVAPPAGAPTSAPTPGDDGADGPDAPARPSGGSLPFLPPDDEPLPAGGSTSPLRVVLVLVALLAVAGGAVTFLGRSAEEPAQAEAETTTTEAPVATGPVAGTRGGEPARIADVEDFCYAWPSLGRYVYELTAHMNDAETLYDVLPFATSEHKPAADGLELVMAAYGPDGPSDEARSLQGWIRSTHQPPDGWDLQALRDRTALVPTEGRPLQVAYDEACAPDAADG